MNINAPGFCNWLSGVLEMNETLTPQQITLVKSRLSDAFLHDIDQTFPADQQAALHAAHVGLPEGVEIIGGVTYIKGVKMGRDGVTPDRETHFDPNSWNYEPGARC